MFSSFAGFARKTGEIKKQAEIHKTGKKSFPGLFAG